MTYFLSAIATLISLLIEFEIGLFHFDVKLLIKLFVIYKLLLGYVIGSFTSDWLSGSSTVIISPLDNDYISVLISLSFNILLG